MRFKEFLLKENNENYFVVKVGDILTALQTIYEDSGVMSKKDTDDYLMNVVNRMRPLLKTKANPVYLKTVQRVAINLMKYLDPQTPTFNIDTKALILSCVKELENLVSGKGSTLNKINQKEEDGLPKPEDSINSGLKKQSSNMKDADPSNPGMETGADNYNAPPMAGDGSRTLNVI